MTEEFFDDFLEHLPSFRWFIADYFGEDAVEKLVQMARDKNNSLLAALNDIWYQLPSGMFNIRENPPGWSEFLDLLEVD